MIINSIIFGSGGGGNGVDINYQTIYPTEQLTFATFFSTYDIRFKYKNSILFICTKQYNATGLSSANRVKFTIIANGNNYGVDLWGFYKNRTNFTTYSWNSAFGYGSSNTVRHDVFSVNASTGRISSTLASILCDVGTCVSIWEMPYDPQDNLNVELDTTPWGTT